MNKSFYRLAISFIPNIGPTLGTYIYEKQIDPDNFWKASYGELLSEYKSSEELAAKIVKLRRKIDPENVANKLKKDQIDWVTIDRLSYPMKLKNISHPPSTLFYRGNLELAYNTCIAIVGARKASAYGRNITEEFAGFLASRQLVIVSGMALGIDSFAHLAALKNGGDTIAVLGCGIDIAYPPSNRKLYEKIKESGCIISEYPPGTDPLPFRFPARNRIISGLSDVTVVAEAGHKSGALLTADYAIGQGREVCAVPGSINSPFSRGPHKLIKNGASLVESPEDVLEIIGLNSTKNFKKDATFSNLDNEELQLLNAIPFSPLHIDEITANQNLPAKQIAALLSILEIKGYISQNAGKFYQRNK